MHHSVAFALTVGLVLATTSGAACGGGERHTHGDFVYAAGEICQEANRRFRRVEVVHPDAREAVAALTDIIEVGAAAIRDLRKVKPAKGDEQAVASWLGTLEQALDEIDYARALVRQGRIVRAVGAVGRADVLTERARRLASRLGLARVCAVPRILPAD